MRISDESRIRERMIGAVSSEEQCGMDIREHELVLVVVLMLNSLYVYSRKANGEIPLWGFVGSVEDFWWESFQILLVFTAV